MYFASITLDRRIHGKQPDGHPCHKVLPFDVENDKGIKVEIIQCCFLGKDLGYSMIRLTDLDRTHGPFLDVKGMHYNEYGEYSINKVSNNQYVAIVMNNNCQLAGIVAESGCFLTSAIPYDDNVIEWRVVAPHKTYLKRLVNRMREEGYGVMVNATQDFETENLLTPAQDRYLHAALREGYYEIPRKISLDDLSVKLGVAKSTLSVAIREAERKLIRYHLFTKNEFGA